MTCLRRTGFLLTVSVLPLLSQTQNFSAGAIKRPPVVKTKVEPRYTDAALRARVVGTALLEARVDANGVPADVQLVQWKPVGAKGADPLGLDVAALEAVKQWRFYPRIVDGRPLPYRVSIALVLHPDGCTFTAIPDYESVSATKENSRFQLLIPIVLCSRFPGNPVLIMRGSEIGFEPGGLEAFRKTLDLQQARLRFDELPASILLAPDGGQERGQASKFREKRRNSRLSPFCAF